MPADLQRLRLDALHLAMTAQCEFPSSRFRDSLALDLPPALALAGVQE